MIYSRSLESVPQMIVLPSQVLQTGCQNRSVVQIYIVILNL